MCLAAEPRKAKVLSASLRRLHMCAAFSWKMQGTVSSHGTHNGERARECDVSVGADSSAAHTEATLKRFGKNLVCKKSGIITREAENHVLQPSLKPHVCSGHGPSLMEVADIYICQGTSANARERPSVSRPDSWMLSGQ